MSPVCVLYLERLYFLTPNKFDQILMQVFWMSQSFRISMPKKNDQKKKGRRNHFSKHSNPHRFLSSFRRWLDKTNKKDDEWKKKLVELSPLWFWLMWLLLTERQQCFSKGARAPVYLFRTIDRRSSKQAYFFYQRTEASRRGHSKPPQVTGKSPPKWRWCSLGYYHKLWWLFFSSSLDQVRQMVNEEG